MPRRHRKFPAPYPWLFHDPAGNLQEVSASQLAVQKAKRSEVRMFGEIMVKDHNESEQQLLALAKNRGISLAAAATGGIQPDIALKNAGDNFDQLYVHGMVSAHGAAVQSFAAYAINGKDPAVKAWAREMLPKLKTHHDYISTLENVINQHLGFINVSSSAFMEGGIIPAKYSCEGSQASPPLNFKGIPAGAKSLAIIVHDPDAPKAGGRDPLGGLEHSGERYYSGKFQGRRPRAEQ